MSRTFREIDPFAADLTPAFGAKLLGKTNGAIYNRPPPAFIDKPFSGQFYNEWMKEVAIRGPDEFCAEVSGAVVYGERAVVSSSGALLTDYRTQYPEQRIFSRECRDFEFMRDTIETDGWLSSPRVDRTDVEVDGDICLISSWEHWNYGAVLLRAVPKILLMKEFGLEGMSVLSPVSDWHLDLLRTFGVSSVIPHDRDKSYFVKRLFLPSQRNRGHFLTPEVAAFFQRVGAENKTQLNFECGPYLYVSRISQGKQRPDYRRCVNEEELADALCKYGFCVFEPERFSIRDQIAAFSRAKLVVGPSGAGMFNTIFCKAGTAILSIEPLPNWFGQHCNMFASCGHRYSFVTGGAIASDMAQVQKSWVADIPSIILRVEHLMRQEESPAIITCTG